MAAAKPVAKQAPAAKGAARKGAGPKDRAQKAPRPGGLQTKLEVGPTGDHYEREADRVARQVVGGGGAAVTIPPTITPLGAQRKAIASPAKPEEKQKVQKKAAEPAPGSKEDRKPAAKAQRKAAGLAPKAKDDKKLGAKVQRKAAGPAPKVEDDKRPKAKVQREALGDGVGAAPGGVADSIARMQSGSGGVLDSGTRGLMEGRFGRSFDGVRVHRGRDAAMAAQALNARAFTVGRDVFFGAGQYQPQSRSGRELIAHELTHTVQQAGVPGVAARKFVQRGGPPGKGAANVPDEKDKAAPATTTFVSQQLEGASLDTKDLGETRGTITLPVLALPTIGSVLKGTSGGPAVPVAAKGRGIPAKGAAFTLGPVGERDNSSKAFEVWTAYARANMKAGVRKKLQAMITATPKLAQVKQNGVAIYYLTFQAGGAAGRDNVFIGSLDELADQDAILRPQWSQDGKPLVGRGATLDADHFLELQLGGEDSGKNMWLLQGAYNSSVGSGIKASIENDLRTLKKELDADKTIPATEKPIDVTEMKRRWTLNFKTVDAGAQFPSSEKVPFWTQSQVKAGEHLDKLKIMTEADLVTAGLRLEDQNAIPKVVKIFPSPAGGRMAHVELDDKGGVVPKKEFLYSNIWAEGGTYHGGSTDQDGASLLTLNVTINKVAKGEDGKKKPIGEKGGPVEVLRSPRLGIAGYISRDSIRSQFSQMEFKPLSPLTFADMDISADGALVGTGDVLSSKALFPKLNVPLVLYGDRIMMNFPLPAGGLSLGPIGVSEASIALGVGGEGFFIEGYAGIFVKGLGTGSITAELSQEAGPELKGVFNFDTDFFTPAFVDVNYNLATDTLKASGTLGVEKGRIPGVDSGQVTVAMTRDLIDVQGAIKLGPPLQGTEIKVTYTQDKGLVVGADNIPLPFANLPAIKNATLSVAAARSPEGVWSFTGAGKASLAVPGATGEIDITYRDGLITLHTVAAVAKGPATGTLNFTATNGALDEKGNPIDGAVGQAITAWGRGEVTVAFGKILTGTAGIEYTQDNRIILSGRIALPPAYDVFEKREYNKDLLHIEPPEFPIWGVSVAGIGVGVFAFVDARVSFNAFVGPGQIRDAAVAATMDLDHPEAATVHGHGQFFVPAYAGLSLNVGGGLRARAAVAYGEGRVGLIGSLGIQADASASVDFDWTPSAGLALEAKFAATARPQFELQAEASLTVGVDIKVTEVHHTFGPWKKSLGKFGPDMEMGVEFPARWSEAQGLDLSLENIVVKEPKLDAPALMSGVFDRLAK